MRESFPGHRVEIINSSGGPKPVRPFRVTFPEAEAAQQGKKRKADVSAEPAAESEELPLVRVESYKPPDPGPYPEDDPRQNAVRFTPVQVEAIKAGSQPGLTMVVGPPGDSRLCTFASSFLCLHSFQQLHWFDMISPNGGLPHPFLLSYILHFRCDRRHKEFFLMI